MIPEAQFDCFPRAEDLERRKELQAERDELPELVTPKIDPRGEQLPRTAVRIKPGGRR